MRCRVGIPGLEKSSVTPRFGSYQRARAGAFRFCGADVVEILEEAGQRVKFRATIRVDSGITPLQFLPIPRGQPFRRTAILIAYIVPTIGSSSDDRHPFMHVIMRQEMNLPTNRMATERVLRSPDG